MKQRVAWYWRILITVLLAFVMGLLGFASVERWVAPSLYRSDWSDWIPFRNFEFVVKVIVEFVIYTPIVVPILWCYHYLSFCNFREGETYCGHCHRMMKNLVEPRCTACGEAI